MSHVIKGKTQSLQWLSDLLAYFQIEPIKIPSDYRTRVLETKNLLRDDTSGLVNTMLDFAVSSAIVDYQVQSSNINLTEVLNDWLRTINTDLRGKIPTGINALAKQYFRERWKGSSNLLLRTFWTDKDGLKLPTSLFFVDGEDIKIKSTSEDKVIRLGDEKYYLRVDSDSKNDILLPAQEDEIIFSQKPFESWSSREPVPYIVQRGLFRNLKFLTLLSSKGEYIVGKALEYLLIMKKGTERMAIEGRSEMVYSEEDLQRVSDDLKDLIAKKKNESGIPAYTTNFDTDISEYIPDYRKALDEVLYRPIEKRMLAGLGLVDVVEGSASTRRESILNPKPFISEVRQGIEDFKSLLTDILYTIIEVNKTSRPKWMNNEISLYTPPIVEFMDDKVKAMLRSLYDRGTLSKRTFTELIGEVNYDLEVQRRKDEKTKGEDESMYPPVIQNIEGSLEEGPSVQRTNQTSKPSENKRQTNEQKLPDRVGPEKKNFKASIEDDENIEEGRIVKRKDGWHVLSQDGKNLGGPYATRQEAVKRLQQVEYFKHQGDESINEPYQSNNELPSSVQELPTTAKTIWRTTFNSCIENKESAEQAETSAWRNVNLKYEKQDDKWIRKSKAQMEKSMETLDTDTLLELKQLEILGKKNKLLDKLLGEDKANENSN